MSKEEILRNLSESVVKGDSKKCQNWAKKALEQGIDAYEAIMDGCAEGMRVMSKKYECREVFVPEILLAARAMYNAIEILKPHIKPDIGKNILKIMMDAAGFQTIDLGRDVPLEDFVQKAIENKVDIIAKAKKRMIRRRTKKKAVKRPKKKTAPVSPATQVVPAVAPAPAEVAPTEQRPSPTPS